MPGTTSRNALRYPLTTEAPDGPGAVSQLAADVEQYIGAIGVEYCANLAAIQAIPAARTYTGKRAYAADSQWIYRYSGTAWTLWEASNIASGSFVDTTNGASFDTNGGTFDASVAGGLMTWSYNLYKSSGMATNTAYAILKAGFRPPAGQTVHACGTFGTNVGAAIASVYSDGGTAYNFTTASGTVNAMRGQVQFRLAN